MLLPWRVQKVVVINWICYEQERYKFQLNFEFDRSIVNATCARQQVVNMDVSLVVASLAHPGLPAPNHVAPRGQGWVLFLQHPIPTRPGPRTREHYRKYKRSWENWHRREDRWGKYAWYINKDMAMAVIDILRTDHTYPIWYGRGTYTYRPTDPIYMYKYLYIYIYTYIYIGPVLGRHCSCTCLGR